MKLHVKLGLTDTQLSTLLLRASTSFHCEMKAARVKDRTGAVLAIWPPHNMLGILLIKVVLLIRYNSQRDGLRG